jgi:hypothetical protein
MVMSALVVMELGTIGVAPNFVAQIIQNIAFPIQIVFDPPLAHTAVMMDMELMQLLAVKKSDF